jgi:hypothetical protein
MSAGALAIAYFAFLVAHISYAAGGADSSGYLNEARLLAHGHARAPVHLVDALHVDPSYTSAFVPLGFHASNGGTMVPTYPPGLPAILAIAAAIGGWGVGPFLVGPAAAIGCLFLMYAVARHFDISHPMAIAGAAILAVFPPFVLIAIQPVSDVVATFFALMAIGCALRANPYAAGFAFAAGVAVRPTNALLVIAIVCAVRAERTSLIRIVIGALPIAIALAWFNTAMYGSPLLTGYGIATTANARNVASAFLAFGGWSALMLTPLIVPGGLLAAFDRHVDGWKRTTLIAWFLPFLLFYSFFGISGWWFARYLLPGVPAAVLGFLILLRDLRFSKVFVAIVLLFTIGVPYRMTRKFHVTAIRNENKIYPEAEAWVQRQIPRDALLVAGEMSGSFCYYANRETVRWEMLDRDRFAVLRSHASMSWYAIAIDDNEAARIDFAHRMPGRWTRISNYRQSSLWRLDG